MPTCIRQPNLIRFSIALLMGFSNLAVAQESIEKSRSPTGSPLVQTKGALFEWGGSDRWTIVDSSRAGNSHIIDGSRFQAVSRFPQAWHFNDAIKRYADGADPRVAVAVIAPGFGTHPEIEYASKDVSARFEPDEQLILAQSGTFLAGVIGAKTDERGIEGCTPFARLFPVKLAITSNDANRRDFVFFSQFVDSLTHVIFKISDVRVVVTNVGLNWGQLNLSGAPDKADQDAIINQAILLEGVLKEANDRGILIVSPAGNSSSPKRKLDACWSSPINYLGLKGVKGHPPLENILVVEATDLNRQPAHFSNVGGTVSAPGVDIMGLSLYDDRTFEPRSGYKIESGTSAAAGQVAALAVQMLAYNRKLKPEEVTSILKSHPTERGDDSLAPPIDAYDALIKCRPNSWKDLADFDADGMIDRQDFLALQSAFRLREFHEQTSKILRADLNGDGVVDATRKARLWHPESGEYRSVTDLEVLMAVWEDDEFAPAEDLKNCLVQ